METESLKIRKARRYDLKSLRSILEESIRDLRTGKIVTNEVASILKNVEDAINSENGGEYFVTEHTGKTIGMFGLTQPDDWMLAYAGTSRPVEFGSFFVTASERGKGFGSRMIAFAEGQAKKAGYSELMLNSGPRYAQTAWNLYDKLFERVAIVKDHWGPEFDAPIWRKYLA